ncbi:acyltransferase family protein [Marilutibacter chinensis]|uniref:Acyltransferase n=1 Tax=Marilutibacter chinensis TaxID=2912247 RepID=A0ABS9HRP7_9GAMM|nr:acyltransferase [Lysobacter chinensis]MCF7220953.1 acyltransferase [Lysobacter chinensis]
MSVPVLSPDRPHEHAMTGDAPDARASAKRERVNEIDLLRFIAALAVVFFHYAFRGYAGGDRTIMPYPLLESVAKYGFKGVELFFMISGFVILMTASNGSLRSFAVSRFARLYPAFWACCTLTFVAIVLFGGDRFSASFSQYLVNMTMLSGFVGVPSIDGVYWSLFVELQFYAMVAGVLMIGRISQAQMFLALWLAATILLELFPVAPLRFLLITDYAAYFIAGAAAFLIWSRGSSWLRYGMIGICFILALRDSLGGIEGFERHFDTRMNVIVVVAIIASYFAVMLLIATRRTGAFGRRRWMVAGALTYPLYLIHQNIGYIIFNIAYPAFNPHLVFWGTLLLVLAASYLVHAQIERRCAGALKRTCNRALDGASRWVSRLRTQLSPTARLHRRFGDESTSGKPN